MNYTSIQQQLTEALGWTLLHSLWQGLLIAGILALVIRLIKNKSPQLVYQLCCMSLLALTIWMVFTFLNHFDWPIANEMSLSLISGTAEVQEAGIVTSAVSWQENVELFFQSFVQSYADVLVLLWIVGVSLFGLKWLATLYYTYSLKHHHVSTVSGYWQSRVVHFSNKLKIKKAVTILESTKVDVPMVIGCLKPVILLPASLFTGFSSEQIESIIVHELAHVKSNDFLVGLILSAMEVVLFYHPMYWWISGIIVREREKRCDDMVVAHCGNPLLYARTLFSIAEQKQQRTLALSLQGKKHHLLERIQRVCISKNNNMNTNNNKVGLALSVLLLMAIMAIAQVPSESKSVLIEPIETNVEEPVYLAFLPETDTSECETKRTGLSISKVGEAKLRIVKPLGLDEEKVNRPILKISTDNSSLGGKLRLLTPLDTIPLTSTKNKEGIILITKLDSEGNLAAMEKNPNGRIHQYFIKNKEGDIFLNGKRLSKGNHKLVLPEDTQISVRGKVTILQEDHKGSTARGEIDEAAMAKYHGNLEAYKGELKEYEAALAKVLENRTEQEIEESAHNLARWEELQQDKRREKAEDRELAMVKKAEERHRLLETKKMERKENLLERSALDKIEMEKRFMERKGQPEVMERLLMEQNAEREMALALRQREMEIQAVQRQAELEREHLQLARERDKMELMQLRKNTFVELLIKELTADGLIKKKNKFKFVISKNKLTVNKKKQSAALHKKYLNLYQEYHQTRIGDNSEVTIQKN